MAWPPSGYPFPRNGPDPRTNNTIMETYHVEDHNDINTAMNDVVDRVETLDNISYLAPASGVVALDLSLARNFSISLGAGVGVTALNIINPADFGGNTNAFTVIVNHAGAGSSIAWSLQVNGSASSVAWANGVAPVLSSSVGKVHVLTFHWWAFTWFGFVVAEEMTIV